MKKLKITFLGTGTSAGIPLLTCDCEVCTSTDIRDKRLRSAVLLEIGEKTLVIDVGTDFRQQMLRENVKKIDAVLITHGHKDHIGGLDELRAYNFSSGKSMEIYADEIAIRMIKEQYSYVFKMKDYPGIPKFNLKEVTDKPFTAAEKEIVPIQVLHGNLPITAFRIGDFTYITDASKINEIEKQKIRGTKILVVNAIRQRAHHSHFTLQEALDFIKEINPERAYLTHFSHQIGKHQDVQAILPDNVFMSYDGLKVEL
ncbi:MAG: MBL fold metallo-hydrolase [Chitinophagales bacterium]